VDGPVILSSHIDYHDLYFSFASLTIRKHNFRVMQELLV
jgi:hypothetical protein